MVDVKTFWKALKLSWCRRLMKTEDIWPEILLSELKNGDGITPTRMDIMTAGPTLLAKWSMAVRNPFWKEILTVSSNIFKEILYANPEKICLSPLFNNPLFKIGNRNFNPSEVKKA